MVKTCVKYDLNAIPIITFIRIVNNAMFEKRSADLTEAERNFNKTLDLIKRFSMKTVNQGKLGWISVRNVEPWIDALKEGFIDEQKKQLDKWEEK